MHYHFLCGCECATSDHPDYAHLLININPNCPQHQKAIKSWPPMRPKTIALFAGAIMVHHDHMPRMRGPTKDREPGHRSGHHGVNAGPPAPHLSGM